MNAYNIQLKKNVSFEQYQMAVRVLEAIGIEIEEENNSYDFYYDLDDDDLKKLELAEEQSKLGKTLKSEEVHKQMRGRIWK